MIEPPLVITYPQIEKIIEVNQKVESDFNSWTSENKTEQKIAEAIYKDHILDKKISKPIVAQCFTAILKENIDIKNRIEGDGKFKYLVDAINYVTG